MCGIAGIFNSSQSPEALRISGQYMVKQLHHRGPDSNGIVTRKRANGAGVLLSHTRLKIIDTSDAGAQPMPYDNQTLWIVFNGEIYNYKELRNELIDKGVQFRSNTDTEVILASYRHWGLACFKHFIGMWSIALWDESRDELILSRDRLGVKPLYFAEDGDTLVFGSEPKIIIDQIPKLRRVNMQAVSDYLSFRYALGGNSFFSGVHSVEPGTYKIISGKSIKTINYWSLPIVRNKLDIGEQAALDGINELLTSSVNYRMIADVPVGSFLSGGLDSSALVWQMSQNTNNPIHTFCTGFNEDGFNEFDYARTVAKHCNTKHSEVILDVDSYLESFHKMLLIKDAPIAVPNEIALHKLSLELKKDVTVVLSGEGADELFGGYSRIFRSSYDFQRISQSGGDLPSVLKKNLQKKYTNMNWEGEVDHFLEQYSYISNNDKQNIFTQDVFSSLGSDPHNKSFFNNLWVELEGLSLTEKYMWIFQKVHLEGLLGRLDSATMSASVEGRVPFVDHRLVEFVNQLPLQYKMRWLSHEAEQRAKDLNSDQISENLDITKYLLKKQFKPRLPASIIERKKMGFPVPLGNWLSGQLKDYAIDRLLSSDARTKEIFQSK